MRESTVATYSILTDSQLALIKELKLKSPSFFGKLKLAYMEPTVRYSVPLLPAFRSEMIFSDDLRTGWQAVRVMKTAHPIGTTTTTDRPSKAQGNSWRCSGESHSML
jgi:hypothetical protein